MLFFTSLWRCFFTSIWRCFFTSLWRCFLLVYGAVFTGLWRCYLLVYGSVFLSAYALFFTSLWRCFLPVYSAVFYQPMALFLPVYGDVFLPVYHAFFCQSIKLFFDYEIWPEWKSWGGASATLLFWVEPVYSVLLQSHCESKLVAGAFYITVVFVHYFFRLFLSYFLCFFPNIKRKIRQRDFPWHWVLVTTDNNRSFFMLFSQALLHDWNIACFAL